MKPASFKITRPDRKRYHLAGLVLALAALLGTACGGADTDTAATNTETEQTQTSPTEESEKLVVGYTPPTLTIADFYINMARGFQARAEELGMDVELLIEAPSTHAAAEEQLSITESFINQGVDYLWLSPVAFEAGEPMMIAGNEAGIPIFTGPLLEQYENADVVSYVGFSEFDAGAMQGQYVLDTFGEDIAVAIIQGAPGEFNQQRVDGIKSVLEGTNAEIVAEPVANWDRQEALEAVETIIQGNPELDVVLPVAGDMGLGAVEALRTADKLHSPTEVVGFDCLGQEVNSVIRGEENACVFNNPMGIGALVAESMNAHRNGDSVETEQLVELKVITQENAESTIPAWFRGEEEPPHFPEY